MALQTIENHTDELYEASIKGCTLTLDRLIQADQLILHRVSLNSFSETPLHIASLLGHHDFAIALLRNYPQLATELDSLGQSSLHLASAKGHNEIVKALLTVEKDVCMVRDHEGRIPLHLAVMRGRLEVVGLLIKARPESVRVNLDEETVLHLCIRYHHFEVLEPFMELFKDHHSDHFGSKDRDGNTVLHQAVILHQLKTTRCLLTIPGVQANRNAINNNGFTALDVLEHNHPRRCEFKTLEIRDILVKAGIKTKSGERNVLPQSITTSAQSDSIFPRPQSFLSSIMSRWIKLKISKLDEARGSLMVVATVIATMSYQAAMNPPGGVWQGNTESSSPFCTKENICEAGTAVLAYTHTKTYTTLITLNGLCFFSSLIFILLLLAGLSLNNIIFVMALETLMSVTITLLGQTFLLGVFKLSPNFVFDSQVGRGHKYFMKLWFVLTFVAAFLPCTYQFVYEMKKSLRDRRIVHSLGNERTTA